MTLREVVFRTPVEAEEQVVGQLLELAPDGFRCDPVGDREVEFGLYVDEAGLDALLASLPAQSPTVSEVPGDYAERWKDFHVPLVVGDLWVGPPWQLDAAPAGLERVVIEPGRGFGTGAHPTTRMMLELLLERPPASVVDVGTGSGVLAIVAARRGCSPVVAIDIDQAAIDSARENLTRNAVTGVQLQLGDALREPVPSGELVLANLTLEPLQQLAPRLGRRSAVIASGLLEAQEAQAVAAFAAAGFEPTATRRLDGWAAIVFTGAMP